MNIVLTTINYHKKLKTIKNKHYENIIKRFRISIIIMGCIFHWFINPFKRNLI